MDTTRITDETPEEAARREELAAVEPKPHWFGLRPPADAVGAVWGARAIYTLRTKRTPYHRKGSFRTFYREQLIAGVDMPWDRKQVAGGTEEEQKALFRWLDDKGVPELRKLLVKHYVTTDCDEEVVVERDGFKLLANPRESCGYLYMVAWKLTP